MIQTTIDTPPTYTQDLSSSVRSVIASTSDLSKIRWANALSDRQDRGHPIDETWADAIADPLKLWLKDLSVLEDDDRIAPSVEIISLAIRLAKSLDRNGWPPPYRVVSNGDGGIVFSRRDGVFKSRIEIESDGSICAVLIKGYQLIFRMPLFTLLSQMGQLAS